MRTQPVDPTVGMTDDELAEYYRRTRDLSGFDLEHPELVSPARGRLDVSITVRFTPDEIDTLREAAERQGVKVTTLIRSLAVQHHAGGGQVVDMKGARRLLRSVTREVEALKQKLGGDSAVRVDWRATQKQPAASKAPSAKKTAPAKKATPARKATPAKKSTKSSDLGLAASAEPKTAPRGARSGRSTATGKRPPTPSDTRRKPR